MKRDKKQNINKNLKGGQWPSLISYFTPPRGIIQRALPYGFWTTRLYRSSRYLHNLGSWSAQPTYLDEPKPT